MTRMGVLSGKVAIVTGSGRGIGRAIALRLAREQARVVINDTGGSPNGVGQDPSVADSVAAEIRALGGQACADHHDVGLRSGVEALFRTAVEAFGQLDILVTNAGIVREGAIESILDEDWNAQLRTMLGGTFLCTQLFARHLKSNKRPGRVLMVSSQLGLQGASQVAAYCSAKAAICGFGLSAAQELAEFGITVNILSPMAYTRLTAGLPLMDFPNAEQLMSPDFCGDISAYLVSDAAAQLTGQIIHVQGSQLSAFKIAMTDGVAPKGGERWSVAEIAERWGEIVR
ncbi:MAG TPA: SDR family NAD(P)-dependent oxidoreductase [Polyangiaceae bacterium]|nr:SDR family NAD(P)-dependent oxidoreductase [Polyangiaceae bacterium]